MNLLGAEEYVCGMNHEKGIFLFATEKTLKGEQMKKMKFS